MITSAQEIEELQNLAENLYEHVDPIDSENNLFDFSRAQEYLSSLQVTEVARIAVVCVRDGRFVELAAIRKFWVDKKMTNMGIAGLAPFTANLDRVIMAKAASPDDVIGIVGALEVHDDYHGYIDGAVEVARVAIDGLSRDEAVSALVATSIEAGQTFCPERIVGAWNLFLDMSSGLSAHQQMERISIFQDALDHATLLAKAEVARVSLP